MSVVDFPRIKVSGAGHERGVQLGEQAKAQIHNSIEVYDQTFVHFTGLRWTDVKERALAYEPAIGAYDADLLEEMVGIAEGASVDLADILAINARTEVMYGYSATALAECTSFAARGAATTSGGVLCGQNWDWLPAQAASCILLEMEIPGKPAFITFVEAGLAAKMGFNAAGIGLVTNLLLTEEDDGTPGVPFHAILRGIITSASFEEAKEAIVRADRASSGNFLIASQTGDMVDAEARPGGRGNVHWIEPDNDLLFHANSFCGPIGNWRDRALDSLPDSPGRTDRMETLVRDRHGRLDAATVIAEVTHDHEGKPSSICRHPDEAKHPNERIATLASTIMDLPASTLHLAVGRPCENEHEAIVPSFAGAMATA